ncbi:MaoC family dehydratase [Arthrobacter sp. MA-N2]|uniref:MaoC family dehydratase n=1 Tax=Arthrobacter sp. MA-N2 TaxID=1101188 RepID=UPI000487C1C6|nr:MaoC family dehydratase [Arthrobacter sp. MA-N2]
MSSHEGPYFDELNVGDVFDTAPSLSLTAGRAAVHQSILGGRLRLSLDAGLARRVAGSELADPSFVWDVAIGQSTLVTRRVVANLFYRGLAFHRLPSIGDTLTTRTEVVGLRQNASRASGLAALRITTRDQDERLVLDFWRCAMLPLSSPEVRSGHADDLSAIGTDPDGRSMSAAVASWDLSGFPASNNIAKGDRWILEAGDVVSNATELARLSLNLAHVHHDRFSQPSGRLVYGGHTIGLALAQLTRTLPNLITIAGWHSCDHIGPVREGDTLVSTIEVLDVEHLAGDLKAITLRVLVAAKRDNDESEPVLDWKMTALGK